MINSIFELIQAGLNGLLSDEDREYYLRNIMSDEEKLIGKPFFEMDKHEEEQYEMLTYNNRQGDLKGYDCPICKNRGDMLVIQDGVKYYPDCSCMTIRQSLANMRRSGLGNLLSLYKFSNYKCEHDWQRNAYDKAKEFIDSNSNMFVMAGNTGSGKTHLCTAMARELLRKGYELKYMLWLDESFKIKQQATNSTEYSTLLNELKEVQVLYIDDFFKGDNNVKPSSADIRLAYEIINYRYNKSRSNTSKRYITIISTERDIEQLNEIDGAIAGRIIEQTKPNFLIQLIGQDKNYRILS